MNGPFGDDVQMQLIAVDHQGLFETVLWAYQKVATKGADRAILHRAALAPNYRADPDEVNRLRAAQRLTSSCRRRGHRIWRSAGGTV